MARYFVHAPVAGKAPPMGAALTPPMTRTYAGWSSRGKVHGAPGTQGIPAPGPAATPVNPVAQASVGTFYSDCAPNVIFPALYWENDAPSGKEKFPASVFSDNQMPVPAVAPRNYYTINAYKARRGGQRQVVQPQVVQRWLGMKGTTGG